MMLLQRRISMATTKSQVDRSLRLRSNEISLKAGNTWKDLVQAWHRRSGDL